MREFTMYNVIFFLVLLTELNVHVARNLIKIFKDRHLASKYPFNPILLPYYETLNNFIQTYDGGTFRTFLIFICEQFDLIRKHFL